MSSTNPLLRPDSDSSLDSLSDKVEPLLDVGKNRYVIFPIQHDEFWKMYKAAEANFWTTEELDLSKDLKDWKTLSHNETHFIEHVLA